MKRSIWQVLALYLGASWVALQVVDLLKEHMGLPDWPGPHNTSEAESTSPGLQRSGRHTLRDSLDDCLPKLPTHVETTP